MTGQARRSAGANNAPVAAAPTAKRALAAVDTPAPVRTRPWAVAAVTTALCAGLVLSGSSPVGQSAIATPATATATRDVDTLSRGNIDREALIQVSDASVTPTLAAAPTVYYVSAAAYLRAGPSTTAKALTTLAAGTQVAGNGDAANGWQPVTAGSTSGYVKDRKSVV